MFGLRPHHRNVPGVWGIALLLGIAASPDPMRLGAAVLFTSRPRPVANLLAFLLGGIATGLVSAILAVMLLRDFSPVLVRDVIGRFASGAIMIIIGRCWPVGVRGLRLRPA